MALEPFSPSQSNPWNLAAAAHLVRRTGFGNPQSEVDRALSVGVEAYVDSLMQPHEDPAPPGIWVDSEPFNSLTGPAIQQYRQWNRELQAWWAALMVQEERRLREKMALFWHNHFTTEAEIVYVSQYLYRQNNLFRKEAFGSFAGLLHDVTIDPAMLIYLDLGLSKAGNPNENYPRELLELYSLGEGQYQDQTPHYTEHDIVELSRALTGWVVENGDSRFRSSRFDAAEKEIFGETSNFALGSIGDRDVIELILSQTDRDFGKARAAVFLCEKLYRWFVADVIDRPTVLAMADLLTDSDWKVEPVLKALLKSAHFFSEDVRGALIRSPADYTLGSAATLGLNFEFSVVGTAIARPETHDLLTATTSLAMDLLDPPNVKGWPGGRTWISSVTVPLRIRYLETWAAPYGSARDLGFDPATFIAGAADVNDVRSVAEHLHTMLLPIRTSESVFERTVETLVGGGAEYEWDPTSQTNLLRVRSAIVGLTRLAEFQMM